MQVIFNTIVPTDSPIYGRITFTDKDGKNVLYLHGNGKVDVVGTPHQIASVIIQVTKLMRANNGWKSYIIAQFDNSKFIFKISESNQVTWNGDMPETLQRAFDCINRAVPMF